MMSTLNHHVNKQIPRPIQSIVRMMLKLGNRVHLTVSNPDSAQGKMHTVVQGRSRPTCWTAFEAVVGADVPLTPGPQQRLSIAVPEKCDDIYVKQTKCRQVHEPQDPCPRRSSACRRSSENGERVWVARYPNNLRFTPDCHEPELTFC